MSKKPENQDDEIKLACLRLVLGFLLAMFGLFLSLKMGFQDQPISGVFAGMLTGLVAVFVIGKKP